MGLMPLLEEKETPGLTLPVLLEERPCENDVVCKPGRELSPETEACWNPHIGISQPLEL